MTQTNDKKTLRQRRRRQRGMTLIEIMVVITILGLIAAAVGIAVVPQLNKAKINRTYLDFKSIEGALKLYYTRKGNYPDTGTGLKALVDTQILDDVPKDPWGKDYVYMNEGGKPVIISYGSDGQAGGEDANRDLSSKEPRPEVAMSSPRAPQRGLTLIEMVIAILIAAVLFSAVTVSIGALTGSKAKAAAGELGGMIRALYDTAALTGKTCRIVFDLPAAKDDDGEVKYRAECAAGNITTPRERENELRKAREKDKDEDQGSLRDALGVGGDEPSLQELMAAEKGRVDDSAKFSEFTDEYVEARTMPGAVRLSIWTRHQRAAVTSGPAFLYFFPQGFTERAQIVVKQGSNAWTLKVSPLTGKVAVVGEELEVPRT